MMFLVFQGTCHTQNHVVGNRPNFDEFRSPKFVNAVPGNGAISYSLVPVWIL